MYNTASEIIKESENKELSTNRKRFPTERNKAKRPNVQEKEIDLIVVIVLFQITLQDSTIVHTLPSV